MLLSRSGLTRLVDRLERDGLIARASCHDDARGSYAVLTEAGATKLSAARATHREAVRAHFLSHLGAGELDALASAWGRLGGAAPSGPL